MADRTLDRYSSQCYAGMDGVIDEGACDSKGYGGMLEDVKRVVDGCWLHVALQCAATFLVVLVRAWGAGCLVLERVDWKFRSRQQREAGVSVGFKGGTRVMQEMVVFFLGQASARKSVSSKAVPSGKGGNKLDTPLLIRRDIRCLTEYQQVAEED